MNETLEFVMHGKINGEEITPQTINLSQFNEFNHQAEEFIAGRNGGKLDTVRVSVERGSYCLRVSLSKNLASVVDDEVEKLAREDALGDLDPKRAEIVKMWQSKAKAHEGMFFEVRSSTRSARGLPPLHIGEETNFRFGDESPWVAVEKYIFGTVEEMGGARSPNVHLRLPKSGKLVLVDSNKEYIRGRGGILYEKVLLHVRADEHVRTGELRKLKLIEFVEYNADYDEAALDRFADAGRTAWAQVSDGGEWVRNLRGG